MTALTDGQYEIYGTLIVLAAAAWLAWVVAFLRGWHSRRQAARAYRRLYNSVWTWSDTTPESEWDARFGSVDRYRRLYDSDIEIRDPKPSRPFDWSVDG